MLNEQLEARGFWSAADQEQHMTWKELKAVLLAVLSFLPLLCLQKVLKHKDNQGVVAVLNHLTSQSPTMMDELRKLMELKTNSINIRARYTRSAANVWADKLSRETNIDDWHLNPRIFTYMESRWGPHSIDRFAAQGNTQLPRYNAR
jgi:hypothetical protein